MAPHIRRGNAARSKVRAAIEHVFAQQPRSMAISIRLFSLTPFGSSSATRAWSANKAVHIALGVRADGTKEIGLWLEQNEGAKFWLRVMNELGTSTNREWWHETEA